MSDQALPSLPQRPADSHKGTFGTVLVIGGCAHEGVRMLGAPALAARAAIRSGAGLVRLATPSQILDAALAVCPAATGVPLSTTASGDLISHEVSQTLDAAMESADAIVLGPGLGSGDTVEHLVLRVLSHSTCPVVIDADALNAMAAIPAAWSSARSPCVLTPHPGEWRRLAEPLRLGMDPTDPSQRIEAAESLAQRTGCIVVLKGKASVVSDGHRHWVCERGSPALATAGTGDVLAGLLGGLIGRCVPKPRPELAMLPENIRAKLPVDTTRPLSMYDAVRIGVDAHAACGERWASLHHADGGMLAEELADLIPAELQSRTLNPSDAAPRS